MNWKSVRLELGRTGEFPTGSASRAYLLHLPLDDDGLIDEYALARAPARATVHRFWPSERDIVGNLIRTPRGWTLFSSRGEEEGTVLHLEIQPILMGEDVMLTRRDGRQFPFRVASIKALR